jgi:hypothetical protein
MCVSQKLCVLAAPFTNGDLTVVCYGLSHADVHADGSIATSVAASCNLDADRDFENWGDTFFHLIEVVLLADVPLDCVRSSSMPLLAWTLMTAFVTSL